jgi:cobalt-zinc-cadmium efflux system protein
VLNSLFAVVELVGGLLTNSVSILSDALHDAGDSLSIALAFVLDRQSRRKADARFTFGYRRLSILSALVLSAVLLAGSISMAVFAALRLRHPEAVHAPGMLALAVLGILVNGLAAWRLSRHGGLQHRAVSLHFIEDILGWVAVLVGAVVIHFTGWTWIDPALSIAIAAWVAVNALRNGREALHIMLQGRPAEVHEDELLRRFLAEPGVAGVHDIHLWTLDGHYHVLTAHVEVTGNPDLATLDGVKIRLRAIANSLHIPHATFEIEPHDAGCSLRDCRPEIV